MADRLIQLSGNPTARKIITTLGLPVPLPQPLRRDTDRWKERPLHDRVVIVGGGGELGVQLARTLTRAGAESFVVDGDEAVWKDAGEAWGRRAKALSGDEEAKTRSHALVFDATALRNPGDLHGLWAFFKPRIRSLGKCGRVVVLGRPHDKFKDEGAAATQRALEGFVRSVGREIGRKGSTANLVVVQTGAEDRLEHLLRFVLSDRSAYVSGQVFRVTKTVRRDEPRDTRPLQGKVALVTGAARGIGAATARTLAREGAHVIVLDRPEDDARASAVAADVGGAALLVDLAGDDAPETIRAFVEERYGHIDIVVHNAGITRDKTLANMKESWWDQTIDVNVVAVSRVTTALEGLLSKEGRIVCLSSIAGIAGNVGQTNYGASKAAVIGYVEALGKRLAKRGIAVNAVAPGFIETRMTAAIPTATREVARRLANLSQGGLPVDVAEVITFLSSPGASALCGQTIRVCGGNFVEPEPS